MYKLNLFLKSFFFCISATSFCFAQYAKIDIRIARDNSNFKKIHVFFKPTTEVNNYNIVLWRFAIIAPRDFHNKIISAQSNYSLTSQISSYPFTSPEGDYLEYIVFQNSDTNVWDWVANQEITFLDIELNDDFCQSSIRLLEVSDQVPFSYSYFVNNWISLNLTTVFLNIYGKNYGQIIACDKKFDLEISAENTTRISPSFYKTNLNSYFNYKIKFISGKFPITNILISDSLSYGQEVLGISTQDGWICDCNGNPRVIKCHSTNLIPQTTQEFLIYVKATGVQYFTQKCHAESESYENNIVSNSFLLSIESIIPDPCGSASKNIPIELFRNEQGNVDGFSYYDETEIPLSHFVKSKFYLSGNRPAWSNGATVIYQSGSVVELKPGFSTRLLKEDSSSFEIKIVPCD